MATTSVTSGTDFWPACELPHSPVIANRPDAAGMVVPLCEHGGASFRAIGDEFEDPSRRRGVVAADVLDAWFDPAPSVIDALRSHFEWSARSSPPTGCEGLVRAIARARGVHEDAVVVGAGSSALIYLAMTTWLTPASRALILEPTYGEYAHVLERVVGCEVDRLTLKEEDGFEVPLRAMGERLASGRYDLAVLVNPNNPTGTVVRRDDLQPLLAAAQPRTTVWVDEAYCEYAETCGAAAPAAGQAGRTFQGESAPVSVESFAAASPNIVVCKTMSKVYALSGLRVAYLCGAPALMAGLRRRTPPWAVSLPGQIAGVRALGATDYYRGCWGQTHTLRAELAARLRQAAPWRVVEGCLNSVLCLLPEGVRRSGEIVAACRERGVFVRDCSGLCRAFEGRAVRIAVRNAAENAGILGTVPPM